MELKTGRGEAHTAAGRADAEERRRDAEHTVVGLRTQLAQVRVQGVGVVFRAVALSGDRHFGVLWG